MQAGGKTVVWHNGGTGGYASMMLFDAAAGEGVVVLANAAISVDDLALHLLDPTKKLAEPSRVRTAVKVDPAIYDRLAGRYELAPNFVLTVRRDGDRMVTQATGQGEIEIFPEAEFEYFARVMDAQLSFQARCRRQGDRYRAAPGRPRCAGQAARIAATRGQGTQAMIKADKWIRRMAQATKMIDPFEAGQVREVDGRRIVSYGTSSYGYDIRCSREFKIFTNINSTIVDPKAFDAGSFVDFTGDVCIIPPNSFALARTVEYFRIPRNVLTICLGKSTYAPLRHHRQRDAARARMGGLRDPRVFQHDAASGKNLCERRRGAGDLLRVGRGVRDVLQGSRRQVPGAARGYIAQDLKACVGVVRWPRGPTRNRLDRQRWLNALRLAAGALAFNGPARYRAGDRRCPLSILARMS